jgi:hypothetical protein
MALLGRLSRGVGAAATEATVTAIAAEAGEAVGDEADFLRMRNMTARWKYKRRRRRKRGKEDVFLTSPAMFSFRNSFQFSSSSSSSSSPSSLSSSNLHSLRQVYSTVTTVAPGPPAAAVVVLVFFLLLLALNALVQRHHHHDRVKIHVKFKPVAKTTQTSRPRDNRSCAPPRYPEPCSLRFW